MDNFKRYGWLGCALVIVGTAVVHGAVTQRWSVFEPDTARRDRMHAVAVRHAGITSTDVPNEVPLKERSIASTRKYTDVAGQFVALVTMISGVPGAVATHTPDVCYTASGYTMLSAPKRKTITLPKGEKATFFWADFEKRNETSLERLRIRWAWTTDGTWDAPDGARFKYMRANELFKLYVLTLVPEVDGTPTDDPPHVQAFLGAAFAQHAAAFRDVPEGPQ
jgi:hypothetical protein